MHAFLRETQFSRSQNFRINIKMITDRGKKMEERSLLSSKTRQFERNPIQEQQKESQQTRKGVN